MTEEEAFKLDIDNTLSDYGTEIEIVNITKSYTPATGYVETPGARKKFKAAIGGYESNMIGGLIQVGDLQVTIGNDAAFTINLASDKVIFAGDEYAIINLEPFYFRELKVANVLQVRK